MPPGQWRGYLTSLEEKQLEMAYYRPDFEPPPVQHRPAEAVLGRILKVRPSSRIGWLQKMGAALYPTLSWWHCTGAAAPAQLEALELAWSRAHPARALPARCAVIYR